MQDIGFTEGTVAMLLFGNLSRENLVSTKLTYHRGEAVGRTTFGGTARTCF
jgi:hypothetical protein